MAHYADGTPAKVGDLVVNRPSWNNGETLLIITSIMAASDTCNASAIPLAMRQLDEGSPCFPMGGQSNWTVTLKECMRLDSPAFPIAATKLG